MSALSLAAAKRFLQIPLTSVDASRDSELQDTIDSAESTIADRVGPLEPTALTVRVESYPGAAALLLPTTPARTITSVTPLGGTALVVGDLLIDEDTGILSYANDVGTFGYGSYTVVYQAGWDPLPPDLLNGIKELVRARWSPQRGSNPPGSAGDSTAKTDPSDVLPASVAALLENYEADEQGFA